MNEHRFKSLSMGETLMPEGTNTDIREATTGRKRHFALFEKVTTRTNN